MKDEDSLYTRLMLLSYKLGNNLFLEAIKQGFLTIVPVLFLGAIALVIKSFPITGFQDFLAGWGGGFILTFLNGIYEATYGLLSVYITVSISMSLSRKLFRGKRCTQILTVVLSVICLAESLGVAGSGFSYTAFGNTGAFTALVISLLVPILFKKFQTLFFGEDVKDFMISDEMDNKMFKGGVIPFACCLVLFFGLNTLLFKLSGYSNLNELFASFFGYAFKSMGANLFSGLLFLFNSGILWFFGIHGGNAMELVSQNTFVPGNLDPNVIMSKTFIDVFGLMGGCGATICMIIAVFLFSKRAHHRNLAKVALPTVIFNVNEIMVFGLPIILNPIMLIPFILAPMVSLTIAYAAAYFGIMPIPATMVEWTTPVLLSGYALTKSISGLIVQLIGIICGVCIYAPFVKMLQRVEQTKDEFLITELEQACLAKLKEGEPLLFSKLHHEVLSMSIALGSALKRDIRNHRITMYYQPQVDKAGNIVGVEALLRWDYNGRKILPPLVIAMAKENQVLNELTMEILRKSAADMKPQLQKRSGFKLSVNMVAEQLNDSAYVSELLACAQEAGVCKSLCIEITEETNMDTLYCIPDNIQKLKTHGISFAMDDFSMGHTSLKYLREKLFDYVKLDGSLVKEIMHNDRSAEIVASIIQLGKKLQFKIIAEYVDDEKKKQTLQDLGCNYFQGFLFSPAVPADDPVYSESTPDKSPEHTVN